MNKKDWSGLLVYMIALALVCAALLLMPEHNSPLQLQVFQR